MKIKIAHSEKDYLLRLLEYIDNPEAIKKQFDKFRRDILAGTILALISLLLFSFVYKNPYVFAIAGYVLGNIMTTRVSIKSTYNNLYGTRDYLDREAIEN